MKDPQLTDNDLQRFLRAVDPPATSGLDLAAIEIKLARRRKQRRNVRVGATVAVLGLILSGSWHQVQRASAPPEFKLADRADNNSVVTEVDDGETLTQATDDILLRLRLLSLETELRRLEIERQELTEQMLSAVRHKAELAYYERTLSY